MKEKICIIKVYSYDSYFIELFLKTLDERFNYWKINNLIRENYKITHVMMPVKNNKYVVLRSPHVNKKARDIFELRNYKTLITLKYAVNNGDIINLLFDVLKNHNLGIKTTISFKI